MHIKEQLRFFLSQKNMTAAQLSRAANVPKQCICDWQAGVKPSSISQLKKIADVFGVSLDQFLFAQASSEVKVSIQAYQGNPAKMLTYITDREGRIHDCNDLFAQTLGYTKLEMTNHRGVEFLHFADVGRARTYREQLLREGDLLTMEDFRFFDKQGNIHWFRYHSTTVLKDSYLQLIVEDVTHEFPTEICEKYQGYLSTLLNWTEGQCRKSWLKHGVKKENLSTGPLFHFDESTTDFEMTLDASHRSRLTITMLEVFKAAHESKKKIEISALKNGAHCALTFKLPEALPGILPIATDTMRVDRIDERTMQILIGPPNP